MENKQKKQIVLIITNSDTKIQEISGVIAKTINKSFSMEECKILIRDLIKQGFSSVFLLEIDEMQKQSYLITDHINMIGENPLRGKNNNVIGARFPDQSAIYSSVCFPKAKEIIATTEMKNQKKMPKDTICVSRVLVFCAILGNHAGMRIVALVSPGEEKRIIKKYISTWN